MTKRASGILLHITSLPSGYGIGDFGPQAYKFADFLKQSAQTYWQILPLTPPHIDTGLSPYDCLSAFAGNTMLISPDLLYKSGLLKKNDIAQIPDFQGSEVFHYKTKILNIAVSKFNRFNDEYADFCTQNKYWLEDYALFVALAGRLKNFDWPKWPKIKPDHNLKLAIEKEKVLQFIFFRQWFALKQYCNTRGIKIFGDIPIYVSYKSADVWAHSEIFKLNKSKKMIFKSGVPPDYFSRTGQLWGNPIYKWDYIKKTNYDWWMQRINQNLKLFDVVRIDHFRGLVKFWQVPASQKTAIKGKWLPGPSEDFFKVLFKNFPDANIIVEDLGLITQDVRDLIKKLNLTGMKVLQFAFSDCCGKSPFLPHNYTENCIVYTGTHDNNTTKAWFQNETSPEKRKNLFAYLGRKISAKELNSEMIKLAMSSVARTAIIPIQDYLDMGQNGRMNNPASKKGNWQWRLKEGLLTRKLAHKIFNITTVYGRAK
ncbi:MAG: 4-alpha-glucanotransferase [Planctomycetes bacterium GWF2_41_51]|nr:MAG: 4-alpha-glucanotransferase [Planctomycetes bacterium GWF2_41_51]HBG25517.1 4-alpha-glucanotransferase [Phycisphaerales bacterium]